MNWFPPRDGTPVRLQMQIEESGELLSNQMLPGSANGTCPSCENAARKAIISASPADVLPSGVKRISAIYLFDYMLFAK